MFLCVPGHHRCDGEPHAMVRNGPEYDYVCEDCWLLILVWANYGGQKMIGPTIDIEALRS